MIATVAAIALGVVAGAAEERFTTANNNSVVIHPLAHASVRLDAGGAVVYIDPWSRADLTGAPPADLILITDADAGSHHLDVAAINKLRKSSTQIVMPASGRQKLPEGIVLANGESRTFGALRVDSVAAYDLIPGDPFHAPGVANGYVLTVAGMRILFAGVTECIPELKALGKIDVAFLPMNLPHERMNVAAATACVNALQPKVVYPYHYDQGYTARLAGRNTPITKDGARASVRALSDALRGRAEVRDAEWYPEP
jgi:L-ascorbate metabolism protein UlaG (beta-lactamase superfamily)